MAKTPEKVNSTAFEVDSQKLNEVRGLLSEAKKPVLLLQSQVNK